MREDKNFELELGNQSKQVVEEGLSSFQDQETQTAVISQPVPYPLVRNPYPDQTPREICERWYQIATVTYVKSSSPGFTTFIPFFQLTSYASIQGALRTFRYIKWKSINLRFQSSSLPMTYGWVAYSSYPKNTVPSTGAYSLYPMMSYEDTVLFDLAEQNDVEVKIPWRHPDQWCDWYDQFQRGVSNEVDTLIQPQIYYPQNPVKVLQSTATGSITFKVFARFEGIEAAGHINNYDAYQTQSKGSMGFTMRGVDPNLSHKDEILPHYYGREKEGGPKKSSDPDDEPDDPDLRNNPFGSLVMSHSRYVAGSGTQIAPCRDYTIRDIIDMPTLVNTGLILSADTQVELYDLNDSEYYSRIRFLSQMFRMWRGGRKMTLILFSSPFISARYNVIVAWGKAAPIGTLGNEIIQDVTVRGTTTVEIEVPYLSPGQWMPTYWQVPLTYWTTAPLPRIYIQTVTAPVTVGDVTPVIPFVLYEQAGKTFEFRSLINPSPNQEEAYEAQMRISDFGRVNSYGEDSTQPNSSDTELTVGEISRRWSGREYSGSLLIRTAPAPTRRPYSFPAIKSFSVFDTMSWLFTFWSGQVRLKIVFKEDTNMGCWHTKNFISTDPFGPNPCSRPEDGMVNVMTDLTRVLDVTAPFLYTLQFMPLNKSTAYVTGEQDWDIGSLSRQYWNGYVHGESPLTSPDVDAVYIAGGSDFTYYLPVPPPPKADWPSQLFYPPLQAADAKLVKKIRKIKTKLQPSSQTTTGVEEFKRL